MPTTLVTGAGGYVGQLLVRRLVADGHAVRALARRPGAVWPDGVTEIIGDLVEEPDLAARAADGVDAIVHLAGPSEVLAPKEPDRFLAETVMCAERVAACEVSRAVYVSSVHVYGEALRGGGVVHEETELAPVSVYARSRQQCEEVFEAGAESSLVVLRQTNGFGAPAAVDVHCWHLVTNELCREGATTGRLTLRTHGLQWRDFVPLVDAVRVHRAAAAGELEAGVWNVGSGASVTVRQWAEMIAASFERVTGSPPVVDAPPPPPAGEVELAATVDVSKLRAVGLGVATTAEDALDGVVRFCVEHASELR